MESERETPQPKQRRRLQRRPLHKTPWIIVMILLPVVVFAQTSSDALANLAARIAEKRSELESLSNELELTKTEYNEQLRSLATQQADVETQIKREELRLQQIRQDLENARESVEQNESVLEDVEPLLNQVIERTRQYVQRALPFQVEDRLSELDDLQRLVSEGNLRADTLLSRVWNAVDAEFRLTTDSGIYRQTIQLSGNEQLAEVAKLGMVLMYFRTLDGRYGYVVPVGEGEWRYELASTREEIQQIDNLFESLRRNLREGFFDLPNPLNQDA